jgi:hypothetical protein
MTNCNATMLGADFYDPWADLCCTWKPEVLLEALTTPLQTDPNGGITTKPGGDLDGANSCTGVDVPSWNAYSDGVDAYPSPIYLDDVLISPSPVYLPVLQ